MIVLARREWVVYCLWINGASAAQIATSIGASVGTARKYLDRIRAKLGIGDRVTGATVESYVTRPRAAREIDM